MYYNCTVQYRAFGFSTFVQSMCVTIHFGNVSRVTMVMQSKPKSQPHWNKIN